MRKIKCIILAVVVLLQLSVFITVMADDVGDVVVSLQINNPVMEINGVEFEIDEGRGTAPVITGGRTLVPIRAIIEAFDGNVSWDGETQTVELCMDEDTVSLVIDSYTAYLNGKEHILDAAPSVINGRTMLPIRFIAEGFNLGVAWDGTEGIVTIVKNTFDSYEYEALMSAVPPYKGIPYAEINGNVPYFREYEIIQGSFEYYGELDEAGRCDVCMASVSGDIMPDEERGDISSVLPTGWKSIKYDNVDGGYLYNRCHLLGFQLTGENANRQNLITGTRYLNVEGMLPFENMIADYIEETGNNVMYRVTPVFEGDNLVASGVLMEAFSVEDGGSGISFCVYCYNIQPGIEIDYATGNSSTSVSETLEEYEEAASGYVYRTPTGKRYHTDPQCGGVNSYTVTIEQALSEGLTPCKKCAA